MCQSEFKCVYVCVRESGGEGERKGPLFLFELTVEKQSGCCPFALVVAVSRVLRLEP